MKRFYSLLLSLFSFWLTAVHAQEPIFRNYTVQDYHAQTQNWDVLQMPDGRMAFANNIGMLIYDGDKWSLYPIRNYSVVRALCCDGKAGRIYAGATAEFGYYALNKSTLRLEYHSLSDRLTGTDKQFGEIWNICQPDNGRNGGSVYFQSKSHLFIYTPGGKLRTLRGDGRIEAIGVYRNKVVVATHRSISIVENGRLRRLPGTEMDKLTVVRSLAEYRGRLLIATQQKGLLCYDGHSLRPFDTALQPMLIDAQIFSLDVSGDIVAVGTVRHGLVAKNCRTGDVQNLSVANGLQDNTVLSLFIGKSGDIWMGLDNGIAVAVTSIPFRNLVSRKYNIGSGYTAFANGQTLYLGTNQGLYIRQLPIQQQMNQPAPMPVKGIASQVWNITNVGGSVMCCSDRGLFHVNGISAQMIDGVDGAWNVFALKSRPGYIIALDYLGACLLHKEGTAAPRFVRRLKMSVPASGNAYEDGDGNIWMSNWLQGIYRMKLSDDMTRIDVVQTFNAGNGLVISENNLLCKIDGRIYVSSVNGFYRYDREKKLLVHDSRLSKVFNTYGTALQLKQVDGGDIWAQKPGYLALARRHAGGYQVDSLSYRILCADMKMGIGDISQLDRQNTIINGNTGFFIASNRVQRKVRQYRPLIKRIISTNYGDSTIYQTLMATDSMPSIKIPHSLNSFRIEYVQPEYRSDNAISYQCKLENYDTQWTYTKSTSKEYTQLSRGTYVFRVRAYNLLDGTVKETAVKITVLPAWYETVWAWMAWLMLATGALYLFIKWLARRAERQLRNERIENERRMKEQQTRFEVERTKRQVQMAEAKADQLQAELKHKASELASSTMNLIQQNDMLLQFDDDMRDLSEAVRRDERKTTLTQKVQNIRQMLQSHLNDDKGWEQFEENFNIVYDDFMVNLMREFPNLKKADRKLCAYLKMGLSSKEMASLLNMPVRSIETARYRLRKKLNLEQGDNLSSFIQKFGNGEKNKRDEGDNDGENEENEGDNGGGNVKTD